LCSLNATCFSSFIIPGDFNVDIMSLSPLFIHFDNILQSFLSDKLSWSPPTSTVVILLMSAPKIIVVLQLLLWPSRVILGT
jgi:hypothetical protein